MWTKNTRNVQEDFTNWVHSCPVTTKDASDTMSCLQKFLLSHSKRERVNTDNATEFIKAGQVLQWNRDASAPHHSETTGVPERAISE